MKRLVMLMLIASMVFLAGCQTLPLQVEQDIDPYAKLPTLEGSSFVTCELPSDCVTYLEANGVFDVSSTCRQNTCYYETVPSVTVNPDVGGADA